MTVNHPSSSQLHLRIAEENGGSHYYITDGRDEARFTRHRKGLYCRGGQTVKKAVNRPGNTLSTLGMNHSAIAVMKALSENLTNLDAVIIRDEGTLSFGMFLWDLGAGGNPGQLPALLERIKGADPHLFNAYFGQFGLDVSAPGAPSANTFTGYLALDGVTLKLPGQKDRLRSLEWAFHFWKSGQEALIQALQIRHAFYRLDTFYRSHRCAPGGYFIADLITSQYGIAQVLDHHISRPGHVEPCLSAALKYSKLPPPQYWTGEDEKLLIETYLTIRAEYGVFPMTDTEKRSAIIKKYMDKGTLSAQRRSFVHGVEASAETETAD